MKELTLEDLMAEPKRVPAQVPAPEFGSGSVVYVLAASPDQKDLAEVQWLSVRKHPTLEVGLRKFLVAWCLCDSKNNQLCDPGTDEEPTKEFMGFMDHIGQKFPAALGERVFEYAMKKLGMSKTDIEELEKNLEPTPGGDGSGAKPDMLESVESVG